MNRPFAQRYNVLLATGKGTYKPLDMDTLDDATAMELSRRILQIVRLQGWQIGKTRVFLRAGQLAQLEVLPAPLLSRATPSRPLACLPACPLA